MSETQKEISLLSHVWASIAATVVLTIICCGVYPLIVWGIAQTVFPNQANGSLVKKDGTYTTKDEEAVGSSLLGQNFSAPQYFHPRPSAAGAGYDAANSSGSNLGPLSDKLINGQTQKDDKGVETLAFDGVRLRTLHYAMDNGITFKTNVSLEEFKDKDGNLDDVKLVDAFHDSNTPLVLTDFSTLIPGDAVTASGSGLDPHISPANAALQKARIAKARGISEDEVQKLIDQYTDGPSLGVLGDPGVNVLMLNLALDTKHPMPATK
jgi:K+-transporting ATPase ATPase C chain